MMIKCVTKSMHVNDKRSYYMLRLAELIHTISVYRFDTNVTQFVFPYTHKSDKLTRFTHLSIDTFYTMYRRSHRTVSAVVRDGSF